jgi:hypothetical protein
MPRMAGGLAHTKASRATRTPPRETARSRCGATAPAVVFGDLMLPPPPTAKHVLIYDKGNDAGMRGAVGGYRRNAEAIYLLGAHGATFGGRSAIVKTRVSAGGNLSRTTGHPHTKPGDVMSSLIEHAPTGTVADPFAGSGSTLVAAKQLGRRAIGVELEERYCEIAARRLSQGVLDFGEGA